MDKSMIHSKSFTGRAEAAKPHQGAELMRILLADDHDLVRETIAAFLEREADAHVQVVATLPEALEAVGTGRPFDVILLDYNMPGMNGLEGLTRMLQEVPKSSSVAILSGTASPEIAETAIKSGARGFVPKTLASRSMASAVKFMAAGEVYAPFDFMQGKAGTTENSPLTTREQQVLAGICQGKSNKEIARDHDLQEVTVKLHVKTLSRKLNARNRTHAAMIARDRNLI